MTNPSDIALQLAVNAFRENRLVLFVGAGVSQTCGYPGWTELILPLAKIAGCQIPKPPTATDLITAFQEVEEKLGRVEISRHFKTHLNDPAKKPGTLHSLIARSAQNTVYTTNYDTLLEDSFKAANRRANPVLTGANRSASPAEAIDIVKLCGDVTHDENNIITLSDYLLFETKKSDLITPLKGDLQGKVFLFVGYSLSDPFIQKKIYECFAETNGNSTHIALALGWANEKIAEWREQGLKIIERHPISEPAGEPDYTTPIEEVLRIIFDVPADSNEPCGQESSNIILEPEPRIEVPLSPSPPLDRIEDKLNRILESVNSPLSGTLNDDAWEDPAQKYLQADFKVAKEKIDRGLFQEAREFFERLMERGQLTDAEFRQRLHFNIGLTYYFAGNYESANESFKQGLDLKGNAKREAVFGALSALLENRAQDVLPLLEPFGDENDDFIRIRAQALQNTDGLDTAISYLQSIETPTESVLICLAENLSSAERFDEAEEVLRKLLDTSDDWLVRFSLATAIAFPILRRLTHRDITPFLLSREDRLRLEEASTLYKVSASVLEKTERNEMKIALWTNLSALESALGRPDHGIVIAEKILSIRPNDTTALGNLYVACAQANNFVKAAEVAEKLCDAEVSEIHFSRWASALFFADKYPEAMAVLDKWAEKYTPPIDEYFCQRARCLLKLENLQQAQNTLIQGKSTHPDSAIIPLEQANLYRITNSLPDANNSFIEAEKRAHTATHYLIRQEYGRFLLSQGKWEEAKERFFQKGEDPRHCPNIDLYLVCLLNLNEVKEADQLIQNLLDEGVSPSATFYDVAARVQRNQLDLGNALIYAERAFGKEPTAERAGLLLELYYRTNQKDKGCEIAHSYCQKHPDEVEAQYNAALAKFRIGQYSEAFKHAVSALELSPESLQTHMLITQFIFLPNFTPPKSQEAVITKSLEFLSEHEKSPITSIAIDDTFSSLKKLLSENTDVKKRLCASYEEGTIPLGMLAHHIGRSLLDMHEVCRTGQLGGIRMATGTHEEQEHEKQVAQNATLVTVDLSALLTLSMLGCLDLLPKMYSDVRVPWAVFEALQAELEELESMPPSRSLLSSNGDDLQLIDIPAEAISQRKKILSELLSFLENPDIHRVGIKERLEFYRDEIENLLGSVSLTPLLSAQPLYSDELMMRQLVGNDGFCTQAFLRTALQREIISLEDYDDYILMLNENHYHFISEGVTTLWRALVRNKFNTSPLLEKLISRIHTETIDKKTSANILGAYMVRVLLFVGNKGSGCEFLVQQVLKELGQLSEKDFESVPGAVFYQIYRGLLWTPELVAGFYRQVMLSIPGSRREILGQVFLEMLSYLERTNREQSLWLEYNAVVRMMAAINLGIKTGIVVLK